MSKEGYTTVFGVFLLLISAILLAYWGEYSVFYWIAGVFALLLVFVVYFFRDPLRVPPQDPNIILSPADGKVLAVEIVKEKLFFEQDVYKISIFLSVFNVHVNYTPCAGKVDFIQYKRGKFLPANWDDASLHNVSSMTSLLTNYGKVAFKQSTGFVARRIVNQLRYDDNVQAGEKFGIIKFGSRVEVFLPLDAEIMVKKNDKVRAAETILAKI